MTVRAQYTRGHRRAARRSPGYLEEEGVPGRLAHRDLRGAAPRGPQLALGRRADLPAHRQAPGAQGHRDRRPAQAGAAPGLPVAGLGRRAGRTSSSSPMQPNEGVSLSLGAKIPGASMRIRPVNMEFLYGTAFMSQSPEAYERLILDAMRGDATLFTRNDEVDAQWSIIDPILQAWDAGHDAPLPTYAAGTPGPEEADALLGDGRPLAGRCERDEVWRERDTTPGARSRRRCATCSPSATTRTHAFVPARVLNLVVVVDREFRGEIENRLERVGRYHPSRLVLCAVEHGRADARRVGGDRHRRRRAAARAHRGRARARRARRSAPRHLRQARHDRRPAAGLRPGDDGVVAARARRGASTRCAGSRRSCSSTPRTSPTCAARSTRAAELAERRVRRRPRVAALDAVARARRGRVRPAGAARRAATAIAAVTVRHRAGLARRRRCCSAAGCPRGWAGSPTRWSQRGDALQRPRARAAGRTSRSRSSRSTMNAPGLAGVTIETAAGEAVSLDRAPGGLAARAPRARRRASRRGRCSAPRAARAASSARASARRCCAIRPMVPRWRAPGRWCRERQHRGPRRSRRRAVAELLVQARRRSHRRSPAARRRKRAYELAAARARRLERRDGLVQRRALRAARPRALELRDGGCGAGCRRSPAPPTVHADGGRARATRRGRRGRMREQLGDDPQLRPHAARPRARTHTLPRCSRTGRRSTSADRLVVGVPEAGLEPFVPRISLTLPAINARAQKVFLVTGADKAEAVRRAFGDAPDPELARGARAAGRRALRSTPPRPGR